MDSLSEFFTQFLQERKYLKNVTPKTEVWYQSAFHAFDVATGCTTPRELSKGTLQRFVIALRQRDVSPVSVNTWSKAMNAFLLWLHHEGHLPEPLRLAPLRVEKKVIPTFNDADQRRLVAFKPKTWMQRRAHLLALTLVDTGLRVEEALGLRRSDVDFDNLLLKVRGKGRKERLVPMSVELRRVLFRALGKPAPFGSEWVFATRAGTRLTQRNALRAHYLLLKAAGLPKSGFHRLRHTFATAYLQNGGDVVRLSRVLGHSQITTTMRYLHMQTADLQKPHQQLSVLNRMR